MGQTAVEIINSFTGKTVCNKVSRLTKQNLFQRFARLLNRLPNADRSLVREDYADVKSAAHNYQVSFYSLFILR
jgi:hypothetical protein